MADPVGAVADTVENVGRSAWGTTKNIFNGVARVAKPLIITSAIVASLSFAMQPALAAGLMETFAAQEAATTLTGAVAQGAGNVLNYGATGVLNSSPVWGAGMEGIEAAGSSISEWWSATDFTPA